MRPACFTNLIGILAFFPHLRINIFIIDDIPSKLIFYRMFSISLWNIFVLILFVCRPSLPATKLGALSQLSLSKTQKLFALEFKIFSNRTLILSNKWNIQRMYFFEMSKIILHYLSSIIISPICWKIQHDNLSWIGL